MNSYAISTCLLSKASLEKNICTGVLNRFTDNTTPYKVVADKKGKILDLYRNLIKTDKNYEVAIWIKHLTSDPTQIEYLDIDFENINCEIFYFIETASKIRNKKQLIVYNHEVIPQEYTYDQETNEINHKNEVIKVLNLSEAIYKFSNDNSTLNIGSVSYNMTKHENTGNVIVGKGSKVSDVQTGNHNKKSIKFQKEPIIIGLIIGIVASLIAAWIWSEM
ncbi:MAG: hypothetical protein LCH54_06740 [Bacteroidetes bacterium]|nr:hypothetical protein [Bacteroidota bacterium]